jgi:hypothetical protein
MHKFTTRESLTNAQIRALRIEAAQAGDAKTVRDCDVALASERGANAARERIARIVALAEGNARLDALTTASLEHDARVCALLDR